MIAMGPSLPQGRTEYLDFYDMDFFDVDGFNNESTIYGDGDGGISSSSLNISGVLGLFNSNSSIGKYLDGNSSNTSVHTTQQYRVSDVYEDVSDMFYQHESPFVVFLIIVYILVFIIGFMGNMFVILVVLRHRHMRTLTNVFFLNLTIGDFMVTIICMPITLGNYVYIDWIYGEIFCKITPFLQSTAVAVSVLSMLSISINRYFAIHIPLRAKILFSKTRVHLMLTSIWALSLAASCPLLVVKTVTSYGIPGVYLARICNEDWGREHLKLIYNFIIFFLLFVCPLVLMSVLYTKISLALWSKDHELLVDGNGHGTVFKGDKGSGGKSNSNGGGSSNNNAHASTKLLRNNNSNYQHHHQQQQHQSYHYLNLLQNAHGQGSATSASAANALAHSNNHRFRSAQVDRLLLQRRKTVRTLVLLVGLFAFSWFPYYVVNAWLDFNSNSSHAGVITNVLYPLVQLLGLSNSSLNPILYCFLSNGFRRAFLNMCCRKNRIVLKRRGAAYCGGRTTSGAGGTGAAYSGAANSCSRSGMVALTVRYRTGGSEDSGVGSVETVLS